MRGNRRARGAAVLAMLALAFAGAPALSAPANDDAAAASKRARALADEHRYAEADSVLRIALRRNPGDTDLLWLEAAVVGWSGRHREAVALYETLLAHHPELGADLRRDLANERILADDAAGAVRDLDARLREEPSDFEAQKLRALALSHADRLAESLAAYDRLLKDHPDDLDLALERARVIAWMGKNDRAVEEYREILRRHPGDERARLGLAQNENWRGNHRAAATIYEEMLRDGLTDPEISKGLAYAYYWEGRPDRSRPALDRFLSTAPNDREGLDLARMLDRDQSPSLTTGYERSDDSDALRVRSTTVEYRHGFFDRTVGSVHWRRDNVQDPAGNRDPYRVGAGLERMWSERWSARVTADYLKPSDDADGIGLAEIGVTHRPTDRLRIDVGFAKSPVLTRLSLAKSITVGAAVAGFDWRVRERAEFHFDQRITWYSDDNRSFRQSARLKATAISEKRFSLALTLGLDHLATDQDLDNGYYDPASYTEIGPGIESEWKPAERWTIGLRGQIGRQQERGSDSELFHNFTASAEVPLGESVGLGIEGSRSNSNLASASGFRQNRWAATLTTRF